MEKATIQNSILVQSLGRLATDSWSMQITQRIERLEKRMDEIKPTTTCSSIEAQLAENEKQQQLLAEEKEKLWYRYLEKRRETQAREAEESLEKYVSQKRTREACKRHGIDYHSDSDSDHN